MLCRKMVSWRKYRFMRSCWVMIGEPGRLALALSLIEPADPSELADRRFLCLRFGAFALLSYSVSVSVSVMGPSVSVAVSPSVAEGVGRSIEETEDVDTARSWETGLSLDFLVDDPEDVDARGAR